jgi:hypothetical protein
MVTLGGQLASVRCFARMSRVTENFVEESAATVPLFVCLRLSHGQTEEIPGYLAPVSGFE